jgi:hypothetical protein
MKLSAALILASIAGTAAFTASAPKTVLSSLRLSENVVEPEQEVAPVEELPSMSQALPFMERPAALDGTMVGDVGFDPLGFAKTNEDLVNNREAEIKHARLAMLAAAGWPISELFDRKIANLVGMTPIVDASDRAPSLLNGGLGKISPVYWVACLLAAGAIDLYGISRAKSNDPEYFPGNLGFDPLGLYPKDKAGQERMQLAELKNGRLGMIAVTAFAVQEAVWKLGVVDETPVFFKPIGIVIREYTNSGYYTPN